MRIRNNTLVVLMLGLIGLLGRIFLRVPETRPAAGYRSLEPALATRQRIHEAYGKLPLYFVENRAQLNAQVAYYVQGRDTSLYFTRQGLTLALAGRGAGAMPAPRWQPVSWTRPAVPAGLRRWAVRLDFLGANPAVQPQGRDRTPAVVSYFKGPPARWRAGGGMDLMPGDVLYAGVVPTMAGIYQINVRLPATTVDGDLSLRVRVGNFTTPPGGFLTVSR